MLPTLAQLSYTALHCADKCTYDEFVEVGSVPVIMPPAVCEWCNNLCRMVGMVIKIDSGDSTVECRLCEYCLFSMKLEDAFYVSEKTSAKDLLQLLERADCYCIVSGGIMYLFSDARIGYDLIYCRNLLQ
jgi:hypothetical protein